MVSVDSKLRCVGEPVTPNYITSLQDVARASSKLNDHLCAIKRISFHISRESSNQRQHAVADVTADSVSRTIASELNAFYNKQIWSRPDL